MSKAKNPSRGWRYSALETYHASALPSLIEPCHVIIAGDEITISHVDPDIGPVTLKGSEVEPGHFKLRSPQGGTLTLHRFSNSDRLEGYWSDHGYHGMWTVDLSDDPDDAVS